MSKSRIETKNIDIANQILQRVKSHRFMEELFWVKVYSNGREQGFCIIGWTGASEFHASFAEHRSSDEIVVYAEENDYPDRRPDTQLGRGTWDDENVPSDTAYRAARYFKPGAFDKAAKYIVSQMRKYEKRAKADRKEQGTK